MTLPKFLTSSVDSSKMALTVKGILIGIIPLILFLASVNGVVLVQGELNSVVDAISVFIVSIGGTISTAITLIGLVRKIAVKFADKNENE